MELTAEYWNMFGHFTQHVRQEELRTLLNVVVILGHSVTYLIVVMVKAELQHCKPMQTQYLQHQAVLF